MTIILKHRDVALVAVFICCNCTYRLRPAAFLQIAACKNNLSKSESLSVVK